MEKLFFIIDDDSLQNEIHTILLNKFIPEAKVQCYLNSKKAITALEKGLNPDIIFLDLNIPGEGVTDFLDAHQRKNYQSEIYLMSSLVYIDDTKLMKKYPAIRDFITKPLLDYKLKSIVRQYA